MAGRLDQQKIVNKALQTNNHLQIVKDTYRVKSARHSSAPRRHNHQPSFQRTASHSPIELHAQKKVIQPNLQNQPEQALNYFITELCSPQSKVVQDVGVGKSQTAVDLRESMSICRVVMTPMSNQSKGPPPSEKIDLHLNPARELKQNLVESLEFNSCIEDVQTAFRLPENTNSSHQTPRYQHSALSNQQQRQ